MKRKAVSILVLGALLVSLVMPNLGLAAADFSYIKVLLNSMGSPGSVTFVVRGAYRIAEAPDVDLYPGVTYTISAAGSGTQLAYNNGLGPVALDLPASVTFRQYSNGTSGNYLYINNPGYGWRYYTGDMLFKRPPGAGYLQLVNTLFLETYLYGVVAYEMSDGWPLEALKAQAVCARTYSMKYMQANYSNWYHIGDTSSNQVYKGFPLNSDGTPQQNVINAVNATRGQVITIGDPAQMVLADGVFSASNGGQVRTANMHWGSANTYHVFKDDPYDLRNPASPAFTYIFPVTNDAATLNLLNAVDRSKVGTLMELLKAALVSALQAQQGIACTAEGITINGIKSATPAVPVPGLPQGSREFTEIDVTVTVTVSGDAAPAPQQGVVHTSGGNLNIRSQPNTSASVVGLAPNGATLDVLDANAAAGWYRVRYNGVTGYSSSDYITLIAPTASPTATPTPSPSPSPTPTPTPTATPTSTPAPTDTTAPTDTALPADPATPTPAATDVAEPSASPEASALAGGGASPYAAAVTCDVTVALHYLTKAPDGDWDAHGELKTAFASYSSLIDTGNLWELYAGQSADGRFLYVVARGYGHGVGMSQRGAQQMANEGMTCAQILDFYYNLSTTNARMGTVAVAEKPPEQMPGKGAAAQMATVQAAGLAVRAAANTGATSVATLPQGARVEILGASGDWYRVLYAAAGVAGWACGRSGAAIYIAPDDPPASTPAPGTGTVTASSLRIRKSPGTSAVILASAPKGAKLTILATGLSGGWYKVRYGSVEGYAMGSYIKLSASPQSTPAPAALTGKVTASSLNIRKSGSSTAAIVGRAPRNAVVSILSRNTSTGWYKIQYGTVTGYAAGRYITISSSSSASAPASSGSAAAPPPAAGGSSVAGKANVTSYLSLRKTASSGASCLVKIPRNAALTVLQVCSNTAWLKVGYQGKTGYVLSHYVVVANQAAYKAGTVTAQTLNVRQSAGTGSTAIASIKKESVAVIAATVKSGGTSWYKILVGSGYGYVSASYMRKQGS